jgi:hypothetical protein
MGEIEEPVSCNLYPVMIVVEVPVSCDDIEEVEVPVSYNDIEEVEVPVYCDTIEKV